MTLLSYNPCIEAEHNLLFSRGAKEDDHTVLVRKTRAVLLPQSCSETLYTLANHNCANVFPNYHARFRYPGKTGQAALFKKTGVPHPPTRIYNNLQEWSERDGRQFCVFPSVFKLSWGGEGNNVALLENENDLDHWLQKAAASEKANKAGFLLQSYIPTGGRSLRVVVIGENYHSYWRVAPQSKNCRAKTADRFYSNLARGAEIDCTSMPDRQEAAKQALRSFCRKTAIDLAGVDFIFSEQESNPKPLFLEINYCFRCKGLGGHDTYVALLTDWVREWLARTSHEKTEPGKERMV